MELYRDTQSLYIAVGLGYIILGILAGSQKWQAWRYHQTGFWSSICTLWLLHSYALHQSIVNHGTTSLNVTTSLSLLVAFAISIYTVGQHGFWGNSTKEMYRFWHVILIPFGIITALPTLWPHAHPFVTQGSFSAHIHWWIGLLSMATLCVATLQAEWLTQWSKRLKKSPQEFESAPSLLMLERTLFGWVYISFALLTITIISGLFFSEAIWHHAFKWSHKVLFTLVTWTLLSILLWKRHREGIRGHTVALWLKWSCCFAVLGYIGSKFVLEILLHR